MKTSEKPTILSSKTFMFYFHSKGMIGCLIIILALINFSTLFAQKPELVLQGGHSGTISSIEFSPDGKYIISAASDQTAILWDVNTGYEIRRFVGHLGDINAAAFSPDGKLVVIVGYYGGELLDVITGKELFSFKGHSSPVFSVSFSPDGKYFITGSGDQTAILWDAATGNEIRKFTGHKGMINSVSFSPDGNYMVTGSDDKTAIIWEVATAKVIATYGHTDRVNSVSFSPDGKSVLSGSNDKTARLWDALSGSWMKTFSESNGQIKCCSFSPDGKKIITGTWNNLLKIWDVASGNEILSLSDPDDGKYIGIYSVAFSPDGNYIISCHCDMVNHKISLIRLWDITNGKVVRTFSGKLNQVNSVAFSPNGNYFLTGSVSHIACLWDLSAGKQIFSLIGHEEPVNSVAFSNDNQFALSGSGPDYLEGKDFTARLWDVSTGKLIRTFTGLKRTVTSVAFTKDGKSILTGSRDPTIKLWDVSTGNEIRTFFQYSTGGVNCVCLSPDEKYIIAGYNDYTARLWDVATSTIIRTFTGHTCPVYCATFSPDGNYIITGSQDKTAKLWEVSTGNEIRTFKGNTDDVGFIYSIAFSSDGKYFITASGDKRIKLWDISSNVEVKIFEGHSGYVKSASFSPDGKQIISCSYDGTSKLWDVASGEVLCTFISIDKTDWAAFTPDGYYMTSKGATKGVHFAQGLNVYTFENFDLIFNRPDIVLQKIGHSDLSLIKSYKQAYLKRLKKTGFTEAQISAEMHLPEIEFGDKNFPLETTTRSISFQVKASDSKYPLDRINVFVNDVPIYGIKGISLRGQNLLQVSKDLTINLSNGKNKVQISVLNSKGAESLKQTYETTYTGEQTNPNLFVVVIGVSEYLNKEMNLGYAAKDANDLATLFENQTGVFGQVKTLRLTDQLATKEKIMKAKEFLMQSTVDDEVILFVAGHGLLDAKLDWYFATHDVDFANPALRGIAYDDLEGLLDGIPARKKLLLMDACNSGEVDKDENVLVTANTSNDGAVKSRGFKVKVVNKTNLGLKNSFELMQDLFANLQKGSGAMVISSASGAEYAFESSEWKNGVFTYAVLEGIRTGKADANQDKQINVSELRDYVFARVKELTNGKQNPTSRQENLEFDFRMW